MSRDSIVLATGLHIYRNTAHQVGIGPIFDRILTELVSKMREMLMDKTELGCLRAIVLFNPGLTFHTLQTFSNYVTGFAGTPHSLKFCVHFAPDG